MTQQLREASAIVQMSRRELLGSVARYSALAALGGFPAMLYSAQETPREKRGVVGVTTIYTPKSHADVIFGKILEGYDQQGGAGPKLKLLALYVEQMPKKDLSRRLCQKYNVPICESIGEAVQLGFQDQTMAGVLSVGEHGNYPYTPDTNQKMYPRRRFFDEIIAAFEQTDRIVPIFNDKHLAYNWKDALHMYKAAHERKIPFMAGSSLPVTWRQPALTLPIGCEIEEALVVGYGKAESYGFHALEMLQCMVERRQGGESGVESVQAVTGEEIWQPLAESRWSKELLQSALSVQDAEKTDNLKEWLTEKATFYLIGYRDGFQATVAMVDGVARQFSFAAKLKDQSKPVACLFALEEKPPYGHFAWLLNAIEHMVYTGKPAYPIERTLLTTGILDRVMHSLAADNHAFETPELEINYQSLDWHYAGTQVGSSP